MFRDMHATLCIATVFFPGSLVAETLHAVLRGSLRAACRRRAGSCFVSAAATWNAPPQLRL